jgi:hypothetical protein
MQPAIPGVLTAPPSADDAVRPALELRAALRTGQADRSSPERERWRVSGGRRQDASGPMGLGAARAVRGRDGARGARSLLHLAGVPWARIGEHVGQRSLRVTADTYSHVLVDEAELDYAQLLKGV